MDEKMLNPCVDMFLNRCWVKQGYNHSNPVPRCVWRGLNDRMITHSCEWYVQRLQDTPTPSKSAQGQEWTAILKASLFGGLSSLSRFAHSQKAG